MNNLFKMWWGLWEHLNLTVISNLFLKHIMVDFLKIRVDFYLIESCLQSSVNLQLMIVKSFKATFCHLNTRYILS